MRTKFNNSELTHVWANQIQTNGTGSSMFFENESIYSYGRHFKIAQIIEYNGKKCALFNNRSYSNTTTKHQILVKRSIPTNYPVFNVITFPNDLNCLTGHRDNLNNYLTEAEKHKELTKTATKLKEQNINMVNYYLNNFRNYCEFFNINDLSKLIFAFLNGLSIEERYNNLSNWTNDYINSDTYKSYLIRKAENEKKQEQKRIEASKENIAKFRSFQTSTVYGIGLSLLRFNADTNEIETSGGVKMSKNIFFDAYQRLINGTLQIGQHIGNYRFNDFKDDILTVGCHKIPMIEVKNMAAFIQG